jgi:hypothetical protein
MLDDWVEAEQPGTHLEPKLEKLILDDYIDLTLRKDSTGKYNPEDL